MARPLRIDFDGAFHHVTNRGARREQIFYCDEDRQDLLELIGLAHLRYGILIHSFCFMSNHIHLVVETPSSNLSNAMHLIESVYVQRFNRRHGIDGPLFKGRFFSRLIDTDGYLHRAVVYVEQNPLKAGIVNDLESFQWSSYHHFLNHPATRPTWLSSRALRMSGISSDSELRQLVESQDAEHTLDMSRFPTVIGSDSFITATLKRAKSNYQTIGHVRAAILRPTISEVEAAVRDVFEATSANLRQPTPGRRDLARLASIGLAQEAAGLSLAQVAALYEFASPQSAGVVASRFRRRAREDHDFALKVDQVRRQLSGGRQASQEVPTC